MAEARASSLPVADARPRADPPPVRAMRALRCGSGCSSSRCSFSRCFSSFPLAAVFYEALRKGVSAYAAAITDADALHAIGLTLIAALIAVPLNALFGLAAAWAITKFEFRGKQLLITLIDLPFSVSPVISGLVYMLLFGAQGWFGSFLVAITT